VNPPSIIDNKLPTPNEETAVARIRGELEKNTAPRWRRIIQKFIAAALGSIPWVGGFLSAAASMSAEESAAKKDDLRTQWLEEHHRKLMQLRSTLDDISARFEKLGPEIEDRVESEEYLALVRQAFRTWDRAETDEKRRYVANVITNAAGTKLCADDVVRLFIGWLDIYHESHFMVIREIYRHPGITRYDIWDQIFGEFPREDSAEADLYKLLIRDLSTGGVIRQSRVTNVAGQFLRKKPAKGPRIPSSTMESPFEDTKPYELTGLGQQFVHYTMNEVVTRIGSGVASQTW
jgi:hypothetical protein